MRRVLGVVLWLVVLSGVCHAKCLPDRAEYLWRIAEPYLQQVDQFTTDKDAEEWVVKQMETELDALRDVSKKKDDQLVYDYFITSPKIVVCTGSVCAEVTRTDTAAYFRTLGWRLTGRGYLCLRPKIKTLMPEIVDKWRRVKYHDSTHFKTYLDTEYERLSKQNEGI